MTFMSIKNEFEVFPEVVRVEDACDLLAVVVVTCDSFKLVVALWPPTDPASVSPNIKTIEPKPNSTTITTTATDLFKPSP